MVDFKEMCYFCGKDHEVLTVNNIVGVLAHNECVEEVISKCNSSLPYLNSKEISSVALGMERTLG